MHKIAPDALPAAQKMSWSQLGRPNQQMDRSKLLSRGLVTDSYISCEGLTGAHLAVTQSSPFGSAGATTKELNLASLAKPSFQLRCSTGVGCRPTESLF